MSICHNLLNRPLSRNTNTKRWANVGVLEKLCSVTSDKDVVGHPKKGLMKSANSGVFTAHPAMNTSALRYWQR